MTRIAMTLAAAGALALGMSLAAPAFAVEEEEPAAANAAGPKVCNQGFVYSSKQNSCVSYAGAVPISCETGTVYDVDTNSCLQLQAGLHDPQLYQQGLQLARAGAYENALDVLGKVSNRTAPVLTMIGYATRKLGNLDEGIAIYHQALAIDPDNLNTHEYLGEGYLDAGRVDLAEAELGTLEQLCGTDCPQYRALADVIAGNAWN